eukprot:gnl/Chilomastix_cuspidata/1389.p1 GENE.gnl/Chilomastix_cuspidata/1389~~gnl/Chilomastix_cuspidata/1389.p1  ORF type:complete len:633 (+),score=191.20 gnl/Chilomastix_cuspidata/1389:48-1901(+)
MVPRPSKNKAKKREATEIKELEAAILRSAPPSQYDSMASRTYVPPSEFKDLPISKKTLRGLTEHGFTSLTDIQRTSIPHILAGRDVHGIAKTGSGKTLSYLVPLVEHMYRERWQRLDGLGALVLVPTRELAMQVFTVLRKVACRHGFSAGMITGGRPLEEERASMWALGVVIATPGRILQHLDELPDLNVSNARFLVLDEADLMLSMNFEEQLRAILDHLPKKRQTLLFSATSSDREQKRVNQLVSGALRKPERLVVHEEKQKPTPKLLREFWTPVTYPQKLETIYSFIKVHTRERVIIFFATSRQVRFAYEAFRKTRPGVPLMHLSGRNTPLQREKTFAAFRSSNRAVLLTTDITARGLDYPRVDWVLMADCPRDADMYVHRAGRTARFKEAGKSVLFLAPPEEPFLEVLKERGITLKLKKRPRAVPVEGTIAALCAANTHIRALAELAVKAYAKACHTANQQYSTRVKDLPLKEIAASYGLTANPIVRAARGASPSAAAPPAAAAAPPPTEKAAATRFDKKRAKKNLALLEYGAKAMPVETSEELFTTKRLVEPLMDETEIRALEAIEDRRRRERYRKKGLKLFGAASNARQPASDEQHVPARRRRKEAGPPKKK